MNYPAASPTEGRPTNLAIRKKSRMTERGGVFYVAGKNVISMRKVQSGRCFRQILGAIIRERHPPLLGIDQMSVSAAGGEESSPSKIT